MLSVCFWKLWYSSRCTSLNLKEVSTFMILNYALNISYFSQCAVLGKRGITCKLYSIRFNVGITALPLLCCSMNYSWITCCARGLQPPSICTNALGGKFKVLNVRYIIFFNGYNYGIYVTLENCIRVFKGGRKATCLPETSVIW